MEARTVTPGFVPRTPIAQLVAQMLTDGCAPELIVQAVAQAEQQKGRSRSRGSGRGERLPSGWHPSEPGVSFALRRGLTQSQVEIEGEKFKNYWTAKAGQGATKLDWEATWRNWIISTAERKHGPSPAHLQARAHPATRPASTGPDAILAGMARLARRLDERRGPTKPADRQVENNADATVDLDPE
jgi:hypothetical protein